MGWLIALGVLLIAAYAAWEFRGYLLELKRTWNDASPDRAPGPREPEPTWRRRSS